MRCVRRRTLLATLQCVTTNSIISQKIECYEELEATIEVGDELCFVTYDYPEVTVNLTVFFATIKSGEPRCLEHEEIRWITIPQIDDFEFCPADVEIIEKIKLLAKEGKL